MGATTVLPAYSMWSQYNARLRDVVGELTADQLALSAGSHGWPIWAIVGHTACQRVFWVCDFCGEPGAEATRFTDAANNCPGDDDLENVLTSAQLVDALDSSFAIINRSLERWTLELLDEELTRPEFGADWRHTRGSVLQRLLTHDLYHCAELNLTLGSHGLPQIDPWD